MVSPVTLFGVCVGVGMTCAKNALCYLPIYRKPWEHVVSAGATAFAFHWILEKEDVMIKQIEDYYARLDAQQQ